MDGAGEQAKWIEDGNTFVIRLDVRMLKVYGHHFNAPFDTRVATALLLTSRDCLLNFRDCCAVYTFSDEINIFFSDRKSRGKEAETARSTLKNEYYDQKYVRQDVEAIDLLSYTSSFVTYKFNMYLKQQSFNASDEPKLVEAANSSKFSFHGNVIAFQPNESLKYLLKRAKTCIEVSKRAFLRAHCPEVELPSVSATNSHTKLSQLLKNARDKHSFDWSKTNMYFRRGILLKRQLSVAKWTFMDIFDDDVGSDSQLQFLLILDSQLYLSQYRNRFKQFDATSLEQQVGEATLLPNVTIDKVPITAPHNNDHDSHLQAAKRKDDEQDTNDETPAKKRRIRLKKPASTQPSLPLPPSALKLRPSTSPIPSPLAKSVPSPLTTTPSIPSPVGKQTIPSVPSPINKVPHHSTSAPAKQPSVPSPLNKAPHHSTSAPIAQPSVPSPLNKGAKISVPSLAGQPPKNITPPTKTSPTKSGSTRIADFKGFVPDKLSQFTTPSQPLKYTPLTPTLLNPQYTAKSPAKGKDTSTKRSEPTLHKGKEPQKHNQPEDIEDFDPSEVDSLVSKQHRTSTSKTTTTTSTSNKKSTTTALGAGKGLFTSEEIEDSPSPNKQKQKQRTPFQWNFADLDDFLDDDNDSGILDFPPATASNNANKKSSTPNNNKQKTVTSINTLFNHEMEDGNLSDGFVPDTPPNKNKTSTPRGSQQVAGTPDFTQSTYQDSDCESTQQMTPDAQSPPTTSSSSSNTPHQHSHSNSHSMGTPPFTLPRVSPIIPPAFNPPFYRNVTDEIELKLKKRDRPPNFR